MDTILCHPREVFRLAIMASASAIVIAHIIPAALYRVPFYAAWLAICPIFTG